MAYERLSMKDGEVLSASHISHIEDGIKENENNINKKLSVLSVRIFTDDNTDGTQTHRLVMAMSDGTELSVTLPNMGISLNDVVIIKAEDPTSASNGNAGQLWVNSTNATLWVCTYGGNASSTSWLQISGGAGGGNTANLPITLVENNDSSNRIPLRSLNSGMYILKGYFTSYTGGSEKYTFSTGMLVSVVVSGGITYVQIFYAKYNQIQYLELTDSSVTPKFAELVNMESVENKVTQITEDATDTQYPSAKAVREYVEANGVAGDGDSIFVAEYETTPYDEIRSAHNTGKVVILRRDNLQYVLAAAKSGSVIFTNVQGVTLSKITVSSDDMWVESSSTINTGSGGGADTVEVDTTLTQAGMAADAAAVGERFTQYVPTYTLAEGETLDDVPAWAVEVIDPYNDPEQDTVIEDESDGETANPSPTVDTLGITGAIAGQIVKVAAVDENGAPTQWDVAALSEIAEQAAELVDTALLAIIGEVE